MANFNRTRLNKISNSSIGTFTNINRSLINVTECIGSISGTVLTLTSIDIPLDTNNLNKYIFLNDWDPGPDYTTTSVTASANNWIHRDDTSNIPSYAYATSGPLLYLKNSLPTLVTAPTFLEPPSTSTTFSKLIHLKEPYVHDLSGAQTGPCMLGITSAPVAGKLFLFGTVDSVSITDPIKNTFNNFTNIKDIAYNNEAIAAVKIDGSIQVISLRDESDVTRLGQSYAPVTTNAVAIVGMNNTFLVLLSTGELVSWGGLANNSNDLDVAGKTFKIVNSITTNTGTITPVSYLENIVSNKIITSIYSGPKNYGAIDSNGALYIWGGNNIRKDGTDGIKYKSVSLGQNHAIAITQDNKIITWGYNGDNCLEVPQAALEAIANKEDVDVYALDQENSPDGLGGLEPRPRYYDRTLTIPSGELTNIFKYKYPLPLGTPPVVDSGSYNSTIGINGVSTSIWAHTNPPIEQSLSVYHLKTQGKLVFAGCKKDYFNNKYNNFNISNGRIEHIVPWFKLSTGIPFDSGWTPALTPYDIKGNWIYSTGVLNSLADLDPSMGLVIGYLNLGILIFNTPTKVNTGITFNQDLFKQKGIFNGKYFNYLNYNLNKNTEIRILYQISGDPGEIGTYRVDALNGTSIDSQFFVIRTEAPSVLTTNALVKTDTFRGNKNCLSPIGLLDNNKKITLHVNNFMFPNSVFFGTNEGVATISVELNSDATNFISYMKPNREEVWLDPSEIRVWCSTLNRYATNVNVVGPITLEFDSPPGTVAQFCEFILCTPYGYSSLGMIDYQNGVGIV